MEITKNVHLIPGIIANTYVIVDPSGLTLIDAALPHNAGKIIRFIRSLGYELDDIKRILITHADPDHVGSLDPLRHATRAAVATSHLEAEAIRCGQPTRQLQGKGLTQMMMRLMGVVMKVRPSEVDVVLEDGTEIPVLGGMRTIFTPGHTPGHISFWSSTTRVLFAGDSFVIRQDNFLPYQTWNNWDPVKTLESCRLQADLHPAIICGGHGWTDQDIDGKFARSLQPAQSSA